MNYSKFKIEITDDRELLKIFKSCEQHEPPLKSCGSYELPPKSYYPYELLKEALKKAYNIDLQKEAAPSGTFYSVFDNFIKEQNRRHRKRKTLYESIVGKKNVWLPDETKIRLVKDRLVKKKAWFNKATKTLVVKVDPLPLRYKPKRKPSKKRRVSHSLLWQVTHPKKLGKFALPFFLRK